MIVQACINGARRTDAHPRFPWRLGDAVADVTACALAGAAEIHLHPRDEQGVESIAPAVVDPLIGALRNACPGTMLGISSGEWIGGNPDAIPGHIAAWKNPPDYASVNLYEEGALDVMAALYKAGVGIEAGIYSIADAERFRASPFARKAHRILIEIEEQDAAKAVALAGNILSFCRKGGFDRSILAHGLDAPAWALVRFAKEHRCSTRIGLEDTLHLPDGSPAPDNATLVRAALAMMFGT